MREVDRLITLPQRGVQVIPPRETERTIRFVSSASRDEIVNSVVWTEEEKARLRLLITNPIYRKRYPTPDQGRRFMEEVDYGRRELLLEYALDLSNHIAASLGDMEEEPNQYAVVLFGSVATGLVKRPSNPFPSNIDLAVIGQFPLEKRMDLYDRIRMRRQDIQQAILSGISFISPDEKNPGNAGVFIQDTSKVTNNGYQCALEYIAGNAFALHDPENIWATIEQHALRYYSEQQRNATRRKVVLFDTTTSSL